MASANCVVAGASEDDRWPVDIDSLSKGDMIGPDILAPYFGVDFEDRRYQLKLQELRKSLEWTLCRPPLSRNFVLRCDHGSIKILTDVEALEYAPSRFDTNLNGMFLNHNRTLRIEPGELSDDDRKRLNRIVEVQGGLLVAVSRKAVELKAEPYERNTPLSVDLPADPSD